MGNTIPSNKGNNAFDLKMKDAGMICISRKRSVNACFRGVQAFPHPSFYFTPIRDNSFRVNNPYCHREEQQKKYLLFSPFVLKSKNIMGFIAIYI